jgi:prepilin-type N-terminal cleavage/methylation domain-containing protein
MWTLKAGKRGRRAGRGFTLIEVLVVVAIIALLVAVLLPSLARAREMSRRGICAGRLHNMGVAVHSYARDNKGKIIQCHAQGYKADSAGNMPAGVSWGPTVQGNISPAHRAAGTHPAQFVDWQAAAKRYFLDKETWECPNRTGQFMYGGSPSIPDQGYTKAMLLAAGYKVDDTGLDYDQWGLGFQYFGGILQWQTPYGNFKSCSPINDNAKPGWALAGDTLIWAQDARWSYYSQVNLDKVPPHIDHGLRPSGGNVLSFDGAVTWYRYEKMYAIHGWDGEAKTRKGFWYQADLGDYGRAIAVNGRAAVQGWDVTEVGQ